MPSCPHEVTGAGFGGAGTRTLEQLGLGRVPLPVWTRLDRLGRYAAQVTRRGLISLMWHGPGFLLRRMVERARRENRTVLMDEIPGPFRTPPQFLDPAPDARALPVPARRRARKSAVMHRAAYPSPTPVLGYARPPISGNVVNGLGEVRARRPRKPFHSADYQIPASARERFFHLITSFSALRYVFQAQWDNVRATGPVSAARRVSPSASEASVMLKELARALGASLVGITRVRPEHVYEGREVAFSTAICLAMPMAREEVRDAPGGRAHVAVMRAYVDIGRVAVELAEAIRAMGWGAESVTNLSGNAPLLHVPLAIEAGLGQLGKHGSLICREHGSNVRLATVLTALPAAPDEPADIGVDDFCRSCQVCTSNCPPQAIFDDKQIVRGSTKWYVDFDRCIPYFVEHQGCGICIQVCPWSEPGRGSKLSQRLLRNRGRTEAGAERQRPGSGRSP